MTAATRKEVIGKPPKAGTVPKKVRSSDGAGMLHVRVTDALKAEAAITLAGIGFTTSEAIRLFLHRVVAEQRLPLDLKVPNVTTQAAIKEARAIAQRPGRVTTPDEMFASLAKAD